MMLSQSATALFAPTGAPTPSSDPADDTAAASGNSSAGALVSSEEGTWTQVYIGLIALVGLVGGACSVALVTRLLCPRTADKLRVRRMPYFESIRWASRSRVADRSVRVVDIPHEPQNTRWADEVLRPSGALETAVAERDKPYISKLPSAEGQVLAESKRDEGLHSQGRELTPHASARLVGLSNLKRGLNVDQLSTNHSPQREMAVLDVDEGDSTDGAMVDDDQEEDDELEGSAVPRMAKKLPVPRHQRASQRVPSSEMDPTATSALWLHGPSMSATRPAGYRAGGTLMVTDAANGYQPAQRVMPLPKSAANMNINNL